MIFRAHYWVAGGHVHLNCFVAPRPDTTFAKMGSLTCDRGVEFLELRNSLSSWDFLPRDSDSFEKARAK